MSANAVRAVGSAVVVLPLSAWTVMTVSVWARMSCISWLMRMCSSKTASRARMSLSCSAMIRRSSSALSLMSLARLSRPACHAASIGLPANNPATGIVQSLERMITRCKPNAATGSRHDAKPASRQCFTRLAPHRNADITAMSWPINVNEP